MDNCFQAIFEHGVLRPLEPLLLNEDEVVSLSIVPSGANDSAQDEKQAIRQRDMLLAFVAKMESYPDDNPQDGFSNRDHDRLIYGS
jgi:predicted DNA-binding antitoxin AbrB/MazE fold protein